MKQIRKGEILKGTNGCYRHAPVHNRQDLVRIQTSLFAFTLASTPANPKAPKKVSQRQTMYLLRLKGYEQVDTMHRLQDSQKAMVMVRAGDKNHAIVLPDGQVEWHNKRPVTHGEWYSISGLQVKNSRMKEGERRTPVTLPDYQDRLLQALKVNK